MPAFQILVFSATAPTSYRHTCIPSAVAAVASLEESTGHFSVTTSEDASLFDTAESLARFRVIVLLNVAGTFLSDTQLASFQAFVRNGGGVVGVHASTTGMPGNEWYTRLLGGSFNGHPEPQNGVIKVEDCGHPIITLETNKGVMHTADGGPRLQWEWFDEWYNFDKNPRDYGVNVLMTVDETSYTGGIHGGDHPIAWCHEFEGGRVFYTALGHFDVAYQDESFMKILVEGILWTAGVVEKAGAGETDEDKQSM
jgi:type 1 glutamine amidotransferase